MPTEPTNDELWYRILTEGENVPRRMRSVFRLLPSSPRCKMCNSPFKSWGGALMRMTGRQQSRYNPRYCVPCAQFDHPGGAEVALTMLFADVRGSTTLAERMSAVEFGRLMNRFYLVASDVLVKWDAMVDRLLGDEAIGLFIPGMAGPHHARHAVQAARDLLRQTGHDDSSGPWVPVGVGLHTGPAYVGVVGGEERGPMDFTALGDNVNITARLASQAGPGEVLISDSTWGTAGLDLGGLEHRQLELKGKSEPIGVHVLRISAG